MLLNKLKRLIRRLVLGYDINTYYFSQSGEDAILKGFFYHKLMSKQKGFYVDIGAFHPTHGSNTFFFYINNWSGININAAPESMSPFRKTRKRDVNLEMGIALTEGTKKFYYLGDNNSENSFSEEFINRGNNSGKPEHDEMSITTFRLETVLDKYVPPGTTIDFMSIDVEGMDLEVLQSNNWKKYLPRVIVIEMQAKKLTEVFNNPINAYLASLGYEPYAKTLLASNLASVVYAHNTYSF